MRTLPCRERLAGSRTRGASLAPLRKIEITEDPPAKAFQELGLAVTPCDENPEKKNRGEIARENIRCPSAGKGGRERERRGPTTNSGPNG